MRHPRAPRTVRMDQLWLVIETLSIPGLFNFWSWTRINRIESRIESRTKSRIEVRFNIKENISLTWCHVSLLALVWLIWCCVCSNRLCTARASHQKPILWKSAVCAVLENPKYWTSALNKRCTIWISPTLCGLLACIHLLSSWPHSCSKRELGSNCWCYTCSLALSRWCCSRRWSPAGQLY